MKKMFEKIYLERAHWAQEKYCGKIFRKRNEVDTHVYEVCESTWHEGSKKYVVENDKEDSVVKKAD